MTNQGFLQLLAFYVICNTILITIFVAEEKLDSFLKSFSDFKNVTKSVFQNSLFKLWIKWGVLKSFGVAFTMKPYDFK